MNIFLEFAALLFVVVAPVSGNAETSHPVDIFLWGGRTLADVDGRNADHIRAIYEPIVEAYPTLNACAAKPSDDISPTALTASDLRALPNLETAEVCLFYFLSRFKTVDEMIQPMVSLKVDQYEVIPVDHGSYVNMYWSDTNSQIVYDRPLHGLRRLLYRGLHLAIRWDDAEGLKAVRLEPISRIQF